jgi:transcriptional regulator with XRE-family HTH domain
MELDPALVVSQRERTESAAHVDDARIFRQLEERQKGVDHPYVPDHIGQEHCGEIVPHIIVDIAHGAGNPSVVYQHIEMTLFLLNNLGGPLNRVVRRNVKLHEMGAKCLGGSATTLRITSADVDGVPSIEQTTSRLVAKTLVRTGDDRDRHGSIVRPVGPGSQSTSNRRTVSTRHRPSEHRHTRSVAESHSTLGEALQAWRARIRPADVGIPSGTRRRVPGLRREELAALAGLSVDYLVRLEQGRASNPSTDTLAALARALRLTTLERNMLYDIAGATPPRPGAVPCHVPPSVQRMVDRLADTPVGIFSAVWTIIQWNEMWSALQGDPSEWKGKNRNLVWRHFAGDGARVRHGGEAQEAYERELVADLRLATIKYPDDRELKALVESLRVESTTFDSLWDRFEAIPRSSSSKTTTHPSVGDITLDCEVLSVIGSDLRIIVFTATPGTRDAANLDLLSVIGVQEL